MKLLTNIIILTFLCLVYSKKTTDDDNVNVTLSFSLPSGFYNKEKIQLEIQSSHPEAIIYYTLDGHNPTENSTVYEKALTLKNKSEDENVYCMTKDISLGYQPPQKKVNKANIVRAIAKLPDGTFTNIISGTYFVGLDRKELYGDVPVVSLITDPDNLFGYENGIYVLGKSYDDWLAEDPDNVNVDMYRVTGNFNAFRGRQYEKPVTFQYIPGHNTTVDLTQDLGIRIKGQNTRTYQQKSFRLTCRADYGNKNLKYDLIPGNHRSDGKAITKYKSFNLRNGGNDFQSTKMRDNLLQDLLENDIFENQSNDLVVVYLDGEYWGIYYIYEEYSEHYISNYYDIDDKNVAIVKSSISSAESIAELEAGTEKDLSDFLETIDFIIDNDMSVQANYERALKSIDLEGYAWISAIYIYVLVSDGWFNGSNYALWRAIEPVKNIKKADGRWHLMMFDLDFSTGLFGFGGAYDTDAFKKVFINEDRNSNTVITKSIRSLIKNKEFRNIFVNALCDVRNINFETSRVDQHLEELRARIVPLISESSNRYPESEDGDPVAKYNSNVDYLKNWLDNRPLVFLDHMKEFFEFDSPVDVTISSNNFKKGSILINNFNTLTKKYTGPYFKENILYITGKPAAGKKLKSWSYKKCKIVSNNKNTIGIYPKKGCTITANFA